MIEKIVNDTGGLHNRITRRIHLQPFTLAEAEQYLRARQVGLSRMHLLQIYMAMGGIPHYLKEVDAGKSAIQNISDICFTPGGPLRDEFHNLYAALFEHAEGHVEVVRALAQRRQGMMREELVKATQRSNGGGLTKILDELNHSGFLDIQYPLGKKKKERLYRLTDEYSIFYLQFIEQEVQGRTDIWQHLAQTQTYRIWRGYAFENVCLRHLPQIKKALGISGVYTSVHSFTKKGAADAPGAQIDLLLDRKDDVINLIEAKFHSSTFSVDKAYAQVLQQKMDVFATATKTTKHISLALITAAGFAHTPHSIGLVEHTVNIDALFEP